LEVHRLGSPEEHLAIAAPILAATGETVLGVVHVALPLSLLPSLEDANGKRGHIGYQPGRWSQHCVWRGARLVGNKRNLCGFDMIYTREV
jgi:hypothetical protein